MRALRIFFWLMLLGAGVLCPALSFTEVKDMKIVRQTDALDIQVHYPVLGIPGVDAELAAWAENAVISFEHDYGQIEERTPTTPRYVLDIRHTVDHPSSRAVSVMFQVETYTGGAHGTLDILVHNFETQTGLSLTLPYLFVDVEMALNLMSTHCYEELARTLGENRLEDMLRLGTTPDADNFSALALLPHGVRIYFQPYQVAPWAEGPQIVDIPLEALEEALPQMEWWGRVETRSTAR